MMKQQQEEEPNENEITCLLCGENFEVQSTELIIKCALCGKRIMNPLVENQEKYKIWLKQHLNEEEYTWLVKYISEQEVYFHRLQARAILSGSPVETMTPEEYMLTFLPVEIVCIADDILNQDETAKRICKKLGLI